MAAARFYSSTAGAIDLTGSIGSGDTSITVSSTTGLPGTTPFTLVLDPGTATEEIVNVTNVAGLTLTIGRGVDGSSAQAHSAGVGNVRHMATARDFREPQEHIGASAAVHGLSGTVVGTTDTQSLTNKTALAASAATKALVVKGAASQSAALLDVQDSTAASLVAVNPGQNTLSVAGTVDMNNSAAATLYSYVSRFTSSAAAAVAAIFKANASQTADIVQVQNSAGTVLAKFDKDGKLTTPQVTSSGTITGTAITGTTGTFSGAITSPTLTTLTSADTALSGRLDVLETSAWTAITLAGSVTGTLEHRRRGNAVDIRGSVSGTLAGGAFTAISAAAAVPAAARPSTTPARGVAYVGSGTEMGTVEVTTAGTVNVQCASARSSAAFNFTYPAA